MDIALAVAAAYVTIGLCFGFIGAKTAPRGERLRGFVNAGLLWPIVVVMVALNIGHAEGEMPY